jgi:DNA-binding CsgD family transcriptional regulator
VTHAQDKISNPATDRWQQRLADLDVQWRLPADLSDSGEQISDSLRERVKELNCLYGVSQLIDREKRSFEDILAMVVDVLPPSWQYPEIACARIIMNGRMYQSLFFQESPWRMSAPISYPENGTGEISVYYSEHRPDLDEGPFLKEERYLIDALAERLGRVASRNYTETRLKDTNRQVEIERTALREANAALRALMGRIEIEKGEIEQNIVENVRKIVLPIVHEISMTALPGQLDYLAILEENLKSIASPFVRRLALSYQTLTVTEIRICGMIRDGLSSKEIAQLRGVSVATINRHREHIRHKLGITNTKTNLETYLQSTM